MRTIRYDLSKISNCTDDAGRRVVAFSLRSTDGKDETLAAKTAEANSSIFTEELIKLSIVSYEVSDGDKIKLVEVNHVGGFRAFDSWGTKVRNLVVAAWRKMSTPDDQELADFFASATDLT